MGERKITDKTGIISALQTLATLTPNQVTGGIATNQLGTIPLGVYKGSVAFWDLDKANNQPLVSAEQLHIMGVLDGREEGYDLVTVTTPLAAAAASSVVGQLTVPTGETWFVNAVELTIPASGGANIITANWHNSMWTDRVGASTYGQPFAAAAYNFGAGGGNQFDEFGEIQTLLAVTNKGKLLRLPAGAILTLVVTNTTAAAAAAVNTTLQVYGYIGKSLVA